MNKENIKLPSGLQLIRVLAYISGVIMILSSLGIMIAGNLFGVAASSYIKETMYLLLNLVGAILIIVAISRPGEKKFKAVLIFILLDIIFSIVSFFINYQSVYYNIQSIIIDLLTMWYFIRLKNYFLTGSINREDIETKKINKRFWVVLIIVIVVGFAYTVVTGMITGSKLVADRIQITTELQGKGQAEAVTYCKTFDKSKADMCLLQFISFSIAKNTATTTTFVATTTAVNMATSTASTKKSSTTTASVSSVDISICDAMSEDSSKDICYLYLRRCDLVSEKSLIKNVCNKMDNKLK